MKLIYEPKGKAREYSPLALNVYSGGCDHFCDYCYCRFVQRGNWSDTAKPRNLHGLEKDATEASRQILLSFISDPYCKAETKHRATRGVLQVLKAGRCSVAILTKGGSRCLEDLNLFQGWPGGRIKIGATLTFSSDSDSKKHEPGAALPAERLAALEALHEAGIKTWASMEPVLDPAQSLEMIRRAIPFVDAFKVGKLNHAKTETDWKSFAESAVKLLRDAGKCFYVKDDLRTFVPKGFLTAAESDCETVFLPDRD
jgi:DNA repair photolyase